MKIYHICDNCNKEYELDFNVFDCMSFSECTYCGHVNPVWLRISR